MFYGLHLELWLPFMTYELPLYSGLPIYDLRAITLLTVTLLRLTVYNFSHGNQLYIARILRNFDQDMYTVANYNVETR
jgi:hypothetical protein